MQVGAFLLVMVAVLSLYIGYLAVWEGQELAENPLNMRAAAAKADIRRGTIFDAHGRVLAQTQNDGTRSYPQGEVMAHITGYNGENIGSAGLEGHANRELLGLTADMSKLGPLSQLLQTDRGNDLKTTGQAYIADLNFTETEDDKSWTNSYLMDGSKNMRFYLGLINGDFEYGNLNGWDTSGDGRVITQLGSQKPTQGYYMGIVSTGLGYTEKYGRISQSFKVTSENTLSIKWNFLSEEFLEYVGSIYQDYLKISITDGSQTKVLFNKAIDDLADQYSLSQVSPTIVFDRGDVYMTGWQTSTFDISQYHGKTVTLIIETGDIGDSIYDSATLLDEISIY